MIPIVYQARYLRALPILFTTGGATNYSQEERMNAGILAPWDKRYLPVRFPCALLQGSLQTSSISTNLRFMSSLNVFLLSDTVLFNMNDTLLSNSVNKD